MCAWVVLCNVDRSDFEQKKKVKKKVKKRKRKSALKIKIDQIDKFFWQFILILNEMLVIKSTGPLRTAITMGVVYDMKNKGNIPL